MSNEDDWNARSDDDEDVKPTDSTSKIKNVVKQETS